MNMHRSLAISPAALQLRVSVFSPKDAFQESLALSLLPLAPLELSGVAEATAEYPWWLHQ